MRVGVLIRHWISGLASFLAVTMAFCVALVVAITGPPNWGELRGVGDTIGAAFDRVSTFANRQVEAYQQTRERTESAPVAESMDQAPPPVRTAEAPRLEEPAPPSVGIDDLAGGLDEAPAMMSAPSSQRTAPPVLRAPERPRALAAPPPSQSVDISPPVERAVARDSESLTERLLQAVEALIPTMNVTGEEPKPVIKDAAPAPDAYAPEPYGEPATGNPSHDEARRRARGWTPQPGDRFPVDERDLERWGGN